MLYEVKNFIDGEFCSCGDTVESYDPSTGDVWATIPNTSAEEVDRAVKAAKAALPEWSAKSAKERSAILNNVAKLLSERIEEFAQYESKDQGKPVWLATAVDIPRTIYNFKFFADAILYHTETCQTQVEFSAISYTSRLPVGVCGLISPWNLPLYLLSFKMAPALATGNTVVCKPSEMTSVTAYMLAKLCKEAGVPDGVINMTFGTGQVTGDALVKHPDVPLVSFTGSTVTAERIRFAAAPFNKKMSLELGGKNAAVIFDDCDLEKCVDVTTRSSFINQGEICLCTSRIFVQRKIYDKFLEKFVQSAKAMTVGDPSDKSSKLGALISKEHLAKVTSFVKIARDTGATIQCGPDVDLPKKLSRGYYFAPTVITDVTDDSRLMTEEIFGPVVCVVPFDKEQEVIQRVNSVSYGLCATVWTNDINIVHRVAKKLEVGTVWHNCWLIRNLMMPFGGMKDSGTGRESFNDSIEFFTEAKTICSQIADI